MEQFEWRPKKREEKIEHRIIKPALEKEGGVVRGLVFDKEEAGVYKQFQAAKTERLDKEHVEIRNKWYEIAAQKMEEGDFLEAMRILDYHGRAPFLYFEEREDFRKNAEKVRELLEKKRDTGLLPFDEAESFEALRDLRKILFDREKKGEISHETAIQSFREVFSKHRAEREWQKEGYRYVKSRIIDEILNDLKVDNGISLREARERLANGEEFAEMIKLGTDILGLMHISESNVDSGRILAMIEEKEKIYRLSGEQKDNLKNFLKALVSLKDKAITANKDLGDEEIAARTLRGESFGRIEIIRGPFSLDFLCFDIRDFAFFDSGLVNQEGKKTTDVSRDDRKKASKAGGRYAGNGIVAVNATVDSKKPINFYRFGTLLHEEQHIINGIERNPDPGFEWFVNIAILEGGSRLEDLMRTLRGKLKEYRNEYNNNWIADEFIAFVRDGQCSFREISGFLKKQNGLYDYFNSKSRKGYGEKIKEIVGLYKTELPARAQMIINSRAFDKMIKCMIDEVFVKEYHQKIDEAIKAILLLGARHYSLGHIISFLQDTPFNMWLYEARTTSAKPKNKIGNRKS